MKSIHNSGLLIITVVIIILITTPIEGSASWWDKFGEPKYGGEIIIRSTSTPRHFDPHLFMMGAWLICYESLGFPNWAIDRSIWSFRTGFTPIQYRTGLLAKDWETPDPSTIIFNLRDDIYWQDKPPVNGRKFTATDVKHHYDRFMGVGKYSNPSAYLGPFANIESVTATDDLTVVFKFKNPGLSNLVSVSEFDGRNIIESPEAVALEPDGLKDWKNVVGTGPWVLTGYVDGASLTYQRNPNYWGYDERHPQNQLPYADTVKFLVIPDDATAIAALRTAKIDFIYGAKWQEARTLSKTNPELQMVEVPKTGFSVILRCDKTPFDDIKVRKALQMSIDRKTLAETFYGGLIDGVPCGLITPFHTGYCYPYQSWSQKLKDEYAYNPVKAKELLSEAGYPSGFKTNIVAFSTGARSDIQLLEIVKAYFHDIGVEMEITTMDEATIMSFVRAGKHDQMVFWDATGSGFPPEIILPNYTGGYRDNVAFNNDPVYDKIVGKYRSSETGNEAAQYCVEADKYFLGQHWAVNILPLVAYHIVQPTIKGYSGENIGFMGSWGQGPILARLWKKQ